MKQTYDVEFYVLGLLRFAQENVGKTVVLEDEQINQIAEYFTGKTNEKNEYYPWRYLNVSAGKSEFAKKIMGEIEEILKEYGSGVSYNQCELGYYHHRIIFKLKLKLHLCSLKDGLFETIRKIRGSLHKAVREHLKEALVRCPFQISYIYTYPLIVIYNGAEFIRKRQKDGVFSIPTTTFFIEIPEAIKIKEIIEVIVHRTLLRSHFVRISIPSTIVYADKKLGNSIFWELVNGVYYAALYSKKLQDIGKPKSAQDSKALNELNEEILRKFSSYLIEGIVDLEKKEAGNRIAYAALFLSLISIFISIIIKIIR